MAVDENDGNKCVGETKCRSGEGKYPLLSRISVAEIDESTGVSDPAIVCPECPLYSTKIGREEPSVTLGVTFAMEHEEKVKAGLRISNPDTLTPTKWGSLQGLFRGRARYDDWKNTNRKSD